MKKLKMSSPDMLSENVEKIAALFPNCVTETAEGKIIDFDLLKQELNKDIVEGNKERYTLNWPGKKEAIVTANIPTTQTLRPVKEDSVNWDTTENLYIEGDNLEVLKVLQESYLNKVKMIYIDPPYNTGNDFVYKDNFTKNKEEHLEESGQKDEDGNRLVANPESSGRYHSDWLTMMYPRLKLARNLLKDDGVIFISIDDNEVHNLKKICDEIFGEENLIATLIHQRAKGGGQAKYLVKGHDYILTYTKTIQSEISLKRKKVIQQKVYKINGKSYLLNDDVIRKKFGKYDKSLGDRRCFYEELEKYKSKEQIEKIEDKIKSGQYFLKKNTEGFNVICEYISLEDASSKLYSIIKVLSEEGKKDLESLNISFFDYPKPVNLIKLLIESVTFNSLSNDIILDFFSGSSTTAHATMSYNDENGGNRKFICVQLPEKTSEESEAYILGYKTICDIAKERIRRAGKKILEESKTKAGELEFDAKEESELDVGFRVYRLDSSNMQDVYYTPQDYKQENMDLFADNVKPDRTPDDLLAQVILDWGLPLSLDITEETILNKIIYKVAGNSLFACFDDGIDEDFAKEVAKDQPMRMVFKDSNFKDDTAKENVKQLLKQLSPETEMRVI